MSKRATQALAQVLGPALILCSAMSAQQFRSAPFLKSSSNTLWVVLADLNSDGLADVVYVSFTAVSVQLNNGDGTFQPEVAYSTGLGTSRSLLVNDINGDGIPDILVGGNITDTGFVSVLLGKGDGTFQPAMLSRITTESGAWPAMLAIAAGDFNEDGKPDLLLADSINNRIHLLSGDGSGRFTLLSSFTQFTAPQQLIVADLNRDHHLDFIEVNTLSGDLGVYMGFGNGSFASPVRYTAPHSIRSAVLGDVNTDGVPDLVVSGDNHGIDVLIGRADGTFLLAPPPAGAIYGGSSGTVSVIADLNNDGKADVAVTALNGVIILLGNGDATFQPPVTYPVTSSPGPIAVGDLNGDGTLDLAASGGLGPRIGLLYGNGDGTFRSADAYDLWARVGAAAAGDANQDGILDLVVATSRSGVSTLMGDGSGRFNYLPEPLDQGANSPVTTQLADFNSDGHLDAVTIGSTCSIQFGNGDGTFQDLFRLPGSGAFLRGGVVGDFNGDGNADIALLDYQSVFIFLGNGDGTFQTPSSYFTDLGKAVVIGDFNKDGIPDLAVASDAGSSISILLGAGDGSFLPRSVIPLPNSAFDIDSADLNGDGNLDLVVTVGFRNFAEVLLGRGDGTFADPVQLPTVNQEVNVAIADFDQDRIPDLIFSDGNVVTLMYGNGDGSFRTGADYLAGTTPTKPVVADLNADGYPDVVFANSNTNGSSTVTVLMNSGAPVVNGALSQAAPRSRLKR